MTSMARQYLIGVNLLIQFPITWSSFIYTLSHATEVIPAENPAEVAQILFAT